MNQSEQKLNDFIGGRTLEISADDRSLTEPYLLFLKKIYGQKLEAVIFYGSCLSPKMRSATSTPDFFAIVSDGKISGHSFFTRALHFYVPPATQTARLDTPDSTVFKYLYLDLQQLAAVCGHHMKDIFAAGRLSKRVKLIYYRDEKAKQDVVSALASAVVSLTAPVCASLPQQFTFQQYLKTFVGFSYLGEYRIETPGKVDSILGSFEDYLFDLHSLSLEAAESHGLIRAANEDLYDNLTSEPQKRAARKLLRRSKARGLMRWPKVGLTVGHWSEVLFGKLQRKNPDFKVSAFARNHPLICALPYLIRFIAGGYLKVNRD